MFTTGTRPRDARKRRLSLTALGLAPVIVAGGLVLRDRIRLGRRRRTRQRPGDLDRSRSRSWPWSGAMGCVRLCEEGLVCKRDPAPFYGGTTAGKADRSEIDVILTNRGLGFCACGRRNAGRRADRRPGQAVSLAGGAQRTSPAAAVGRSYDPCGPPSSNRCMPDRAGRPGRSSPSAARAPSIAARWAPRAARGQPCAHRRLRQRCPAEGDIPGWADGGGAEAIKAQAVAASHLRARRARRRQENRRHPELAQVYGGASVEDRRTNAAADATAGQVRLAAGKPAFTEFSASTAATPAGGQFPRSGTKGDVISPSHNWTVTLSPNTIGGAFGVGALRSFGGDRANGLGPNWGRAVKVRVVGSAGSVVVTGEDARTTLGLRSSFFAIKGQTSKPRLSHRRGGGSDLGILETIFDELLPGAAQLLEVGTQLINGRFDDLGGLTGVLGRAIGIPNLTPDGQGRHRVVPARHDVLLRRHRSPRAGRACSRRLSEQGRGYRSSASRYDALR